MGKRGPKPQLQCKHGHDLTKLENVLLVQRKKFGKTYVERQCKPCVYKRNKEWRDAKRPSGSGRSNEDS